MAVHHFPPRYTAGAEGRAFRTAAALHARGHDLQVVCVERNDTGPASGVAWEDDVFGGVRVRRLFFNLWTAPDPLHWEYDNPWVGEHLQTWLAAERPDVFHMISGYLLSGRALQVAQALQIPTVVTLTDFWFLCRRITMLRSDGRVSRAPINPVTCAQCLGEEQGRYRWLGRLMPRVMGAYWRHQARAIERVTTRLTFLRDTLNQVDAIISPSQFLRSVFVEAGVEPERVVFSRQGHDVPQLSPATMEKKPTSDLRVGYLGQIAELKGVHVLIEAVRRMPDARLRVWVYGDLQRFPTYTAWLKRLIASDARIELAGAYQGPEALTRVLTGLDVIVVPSLWYENSPNVILEAFAHRTPVVVSDLGGMAELVRDGDNGLRFKPGDAGSLAQQLQRLLDEPGLLPKLQAGIDPIKSVAQEMDELEAIYRQVVAGKPAPTVSPLVPSLTPS